MSTASIRFGGPSAGTRLTAAYLVLGAAAAVVLYPFVMLVLGSLKDEPEFFQNPVGLPWHFAWSNYAIAWQQAHIPQYSINSMIVAGGTVCLTVACAATVSFGLSRFRFRGRNVIYLSFVVLLTLPVQVYIIPLYIIVVRSGLADRYSDWC